MKPYKVLITHEALSLSRPSVHDRQKILSFLESLCSNPFQTGDYEERDAVDRPIQIKIIGKYAELVTEVLKHWPGRWEDKSDPTALHEAGLLQLSTDKAHALLQWSPVWSFSATVEQTVNWYRETRKAPQQALDLTRRQIQGYQADAAKSEVPWAR